MARQPDRHINLAVARAIPVTIFGIIIYACYAITKPLCIDYLIDPLPKYARSSRVGTGAAIIAVFYVLLLVVLITYARLLYNVVWNPDLLPRSSEAAAENQSMHAPPRHSQDRPRRKRKGRHKSKRSEVSDKPAVDVEAALDYNAQPMVLPWDTAGLENFYKKDVFVCQPDGRPLFCSKCCHSKPDRTHHCREVDRCVRKMDHFCPWVGGVVSEKSFKFFIQFVFYTAVFCAFILIVCAILTAELKQDTGEVNPHWAIGIGLSGFFGLFAFGMTMSSLQLAAMNLTTIENLNRRSVVWTLAIRVPNHFLPRLQPGSRWAPTFRTITYPLPAIPPPPPPPMSTHPSGPGAEQGSQPPPPPPPPQTNPPTEQHVFAILQTLPGENPFDLGSPLKNVKQVLGHSVIDWFLPLKRSPCGDHSSAESEFAMGPVVSRLKKEAGLDLAPGAETNNSNHNHRPDPDPHAAPADTDADPDGNADTNDNADGLSKHKHRHKRRRGKHSHHHHQHQQT
ncbi:DHHC family palmitoyltransferase [Aspergillus undulatus]|uniref:DHHC family palmitoyltransferase n=1 Tax=Aspergillus undulatus TaxID=1810928 RepID=UPI003CCD554F